MIQSNLLFYLLAPETMTFGMAVTYFDCLPMRLKRLEFNCMKQCLAFFLGLVLLGKPCSGGNPSIPNLKILFPLKIRSYKMDPLSYGEMSHQGLIQQLYSPLIELDVDGQLTSGLAKSWQWQGSDLLIQLRKNNISSKGALIDGQDIKINLIRIFKLTGQKYNYIFAELCPNATKNDPFNDCKNIQVENSFNVRLKFKKKRPIYIDILSADEFRIVPKASISLNDLKLTDIYNSSGPYELTEFNEGLNRLKMSARRNHWHWRPDMPQKVEFQTYLDENGAELNGNQFKGKFENKEVDLLPTYADTNSIAARIANKPNYNIFQSNPLATYVFFFSTKGRNEFSKDERLAIGYRLKRIFTPLIEKHIMDAEIPEGVFPLASDAGLNANQIESWKASIDLNAQTKLHRKPLIHLKTYMQDLKRFLDKRKQYFDYEVDDTYTFPGNAKLNGKFDGFFSNVSLSAVESADSLFFLKENGWLPFTEKESLALIEKFLESDYRSERIGILKDVHQAILQSGYVIPLSASGYSAISQRNWKLNFASIYGDTPLWQITYAPN